jgi:hypothetical protein
MNTRWTAAGAIATLTFVVTITACVAERPESSSGSGSRDTMGAGGDPGVAASQPADTAALSGQRAVPQPNPQLLTPDGWGPLRIGMSRAEVVAAAGEDATPDAVGGPDPSRCDEFRPSSAPPGVLVMVEENVLTRISLSRTTDIRTPEGFSIGDDASAVLTHYGSRARVEPHQYWAVPAKYITVRSTTSPDGRGIRYEVDSGGKVVHIRAGGPSIEYTEGCV